MVRPTRKGIIDIWNAFMVDGAQMCDNDIPLCPCTLEGEPQLLVSWPRRSVFTGERVAAAIRSFTSAPLCISMSTTRSSMGSFRVYGSVPSVR